MTADQPGRQSGHDCGKITSWTDCRAEETWVRVNGAMGIRLGAMLPPQDVSRKNPARHGPWSMEAFQQCRDDWRGPDRGLHGHNASNSW